MWLGAFTCATHDKGDRPLLQLHHRPGSPSRVRPSCLNPVKANPVTLTDEAITPNPAANGWRHLVATLLVSIAAAAAQAQMPQSLPGVKTTFVRLSNDANALLTEPAQLSPKSRVVVINAHPGKVRAFEYFTGC